MTNTEEHKDFLKTREHFEILDGLRGVAALSIVVFHFMEWIYPDYRENFIGHGFLAVDFFFCLSGFVIAYAYDNRLSEIGIKEFFKSRLIRLHPLVVLGSVLGLIGFLLDPFTSAGTHATGKIILLFLCSLFLIPLPIMEERAFNLFSFNAPSWSLFWEYVANIVYAFILHKINRRLLFVLTMAAAILLCIVSYKAGNLLGGWAKTNFWDGGARVFYSFLAGVLVYRSNWILRNKLGFISLVILLLLAFVMSFGNWNWLAEWLVVVFYFPILISLGAGSGISSGVKSVCRLFGNLSYPLYMTHYAGIWVFGNYFVSRKPSSSELVFIVIKGTILLVLFAWVVMKVYDMPVRRYLTDQRNKRSGTERLVDR